MMKLRKFILLLLLAIPFLFGFLGFLNNDVDIVKKGYLGLDQSATVGDVLDNYAYIKSPQWTLLICNWTYSHIVCHGG